MDFIAKPRLGIAQGLTEYAEEIAEKIRAAALARGPLVGTEKIIRIGASTGGTEAIRELLLQLPPDAPGIVIAQHMPPGFTRSFAQRLDRLCALSVREARGGERILPGHVFVAPGDAHLLVQRSGADYVTALSDAAPVNRHRPSVDVLFRSAVCAGDNAFAALLTGMGKDGAGGLLEMRRAGATTLAQDEACCVVYGMPKEAVALGAVGEVVPPALGERLMALVRQRGVDVRV